MPFCYQFVKKTESMCSCFEKEIAHQSECEEQVDTPHEERKLTSPLQPEQIVSFSCKCGLDVGHKNTRCDQFAMLQAYLI